MKERFFISLDFLDESRNTQKLNFFRQRFDTKFTFNKRLHMAIVPPFDTDSKNTIELVHILEDELESFFYGHKKNLNINFRGMNVFKHKGKSILHLSPELNDLLRYCQESLHEICRQRLHSRDKSFRLTSRFLPIGRFQDEFSLKTGMDILIKEMQFPLELSVTAITLYRRRGRDWQPRIPLYSFETQRKGEEMNSFCFPA